MEETMLFKALREFTTGLLNQLLVNLAGQEGQMWLDEFKKFLRREQCWVKVYLKSLFDGVVVSAADGIETFASSGLFGGVYGLTLPAGSGKPTPATKATVWELILNGIFAQIFGSLGEKRGRWTESQVVAFCRDHRDKLRTDGYGTFFELEGGFVANVYFGGDGRLEVGVDEFSRGGVWSAEYEHRVVSPQQ